MKLGFKEEKEYQIFLGRYLKKLGYEVYTDKKICELPTFHGDKEKPDLLVFYNENKRKHSLIFLSNPFAIETKKSDKLNEVTKSILQIKKYNNKKYYTNNWNGELKTIILSTDLCFINGHCYDWSIANKDFNDGVNWTLNHVLFTISNFSGMLLLKNDKLIVEFHNCVFELKEGGIVDFCDDYNGFNPFHNNLNDNYS